MSFSYYLIISLPLQLYLFVRSRRLLQEKVAGTDARKQIAACTAFLFLLMLIPLVWRVLAGADFDTRASSELRGLFYASSIWSVGAIGSALILIVYSWFRRANPSTEQVSGAAADPGRRDFLKQSVNFAAAVPFAVSGYGVLLERRKFDVEHFEIPLTEVAGPFSSLSVVQLTDIHVGPFMSGEELAQYVEAVNRLNPDLIALTGDFVTSEADEADLCAEVLAGLKARYGIFACIGNHDIYAHADDRLVKRFANYGIHTLRNDGVVVAAGESKISLLGIDDLKWGRPDLGRANAAVQNNPGGLKILLSHRPEIFPTAALAGIDLVLSGHYHGGQVKLFAAPDSLSVARLLTPYAEGQFRLHPSQSQRASSLFVGRGIGTSGLPIRVNCPPQIAYLTLRKA